MVQESTHAAGLVSTGEAPASEEKVLFTVRNSFFAITSIATVLLVWLTGSNWLDAQAQRRDAQLILRSNAVEDLLLETARSWAIERKLTHAALSAREATTQDTLQAVSASRKRADRAFRQALEELSASRSRKDQGELVARTSGLFRTLKGLREKVAIQIQLPPALRDRTVVDAFSPTITELTMASQRLRTASRYRSSTVAREIEALQELKHAVWVMSEFAERESAILAGTIGAHRPLVLNVVERLAKFRGRLEQAWATALSCIDEIDADPVVLGKLEQVGEQYFTAYERIRSPVIRAGMEGPEYDVSTLEWLAQSREAIAPIYELGEAVAAASKNLTRKQEAEGDRNLIVATIILFITVAIAIVSIWTVVTRIARPLDGITRAMMTLASGDERIVVPGTDRKGEIGGMARAVQTFKDSAEARAREISDANLRLQELNVELEDRVRQRTAELALARDQAVSASQSKSEFLASMSHELRTPLNAIMGFSDVLIKKTKNDGPALYLDPLQRINRAGEHLLQLINDVLDLSKIEAGKMEMKIDTVSLAPIVQDAVNTVRPMADGNSNRLVVTSPDDVQLVLADPTRLRQILLNLLSNASKFTEDGTITIEVRRANRDGSERALIAIADTGVGMTPEQVAQLFAEFTQIDATSTRKFGGTGLGLAISRRFCRMMGGDITVESEAGKGSTFTIDLPVAGGGVREQAPARRPEAAPLVEHHTSPEPGWGKLVLVIDDDASARELLNMVLATEGYEVAFAAEGSEGLRLARDLRPAVITLDVQMPDLDGWSVLAALKADPELMGIPVVMLTIVDDATRGYALGAADYLAKPVDRDLLLAVLSRCTMDRVERSILLVEDDEDTRRLIRETLEDAGCSVVEAANGKLALERLEDSVPDLIVLDLIMPEMDGFDFLVALRLNPTWSDIPVVVVTARDLSEVDRLRLNGAVDEVLEKGAVGGAALLHEIQASIRACLERRPKAKSASRAKVLYVEDNEDNIVLLKTQLEESGYDVIIAGDGKQGVAMAQKESPALILMDMRMPVMDGWEATKVLKGAPETRDIPIIGLSAHAMADDRDKALDAGCDDYVTKPVDLPMLLNKLKQLLS